MPEELVADIRFGCVEWSGMVTNVLRAEEDTKGEAIEKVARTEETRNRAHAKVGTALKKLANILLLRNVVTTVIAVLLQELK
jgi:hypothetical protein